MSLLSKLLGRKDEEAPRAGWPWTLNVGGRETREFAWDDVLRGLRGLVPDQGSYLILEQRDPRDPKEYWYLQSALALQGEHAGQYIVGCGYSRQTGAALLEQYYTGLDGVIPLFEAAYHGKALDLSRFEDHSSWLPVNQKK